jgi:hypothetical protein
LRVSDSGLPARLTLGSLTQAFRAGPGWDPVTGLGSPDARVLILLLAHEIPWQPCLSWPASHHAR